MRRRVRVTIDDVAAAAGVSRQTVTRAMNDMADISPATRQRVLQVARELRYRPSRFGRALAGRDQRTLGLVLHDLTNPYYPELASAVVGAATARGWNVVLADTVHSTEPWADTAALVQQVDVAVGYPRLTLDQIEEAFAGLPFVDLDCEAGTPYGGVELDPTAAMADLARHLVEVGVRHPVALVPTADDGRGRLFRDAMAEHRVAVRTVATGEDAADPTFAATTAMARSPEPVDAVLAFNDRMACWALKALAAAGVDVPGQVRLAGVDGLSLGTVVTPALTTLAVDMTQVARDAVDLAVTMFDGDLPLTGPQVRRRVEHRLVLRESA